MQSITAIVDYDNLQAYLEANLKVATNITPEFIANLKAQWRKDYVARYNKQYRDDHVQITFRLSKKQYQKLTSIAKDQGVKPTVYCRQSIIDIINDNVSQDLQPLKLLCMKLTDIIEETQYEGQALSQEELLPLIYKMQELLL